MHPDEAGINELIAEILMVLLVVGIVIIILVMVMGVSLPAQKTAYLVTSATAVDIANNSIVMLSHNQGDTVSLYPVATYGYPVQITMTNGSVTYTAVPLPQTQEKSWSSGDNLYMVRNASSVILASSPLQVQGNYGFFPGAWTISIVDKSSDVLVAQHTVILKGNSSTQAGYTRYPGFTLEAWIKWNIPPNPGGDTTRKWATIVVDGDRDSNRRYQFQHNSDNTKFEFDLATVSGGGSGSWVASTTTPVSGTWYYVTGVYNKTPGTMAIYVNGASQSTQNIGSSGLRASPGRYQVGGPAGIQWPGPTNMLRKFDGEIRGLTTYEEAFSPAEILAHYSSGVP